MIYKERCDPNTPMIPRTFCFLQPTTVLLKTKNGTGEVTYGIGDKVEVLVPQVIYPVGCTERKETIPLTNGSEIISYPEYMKYSAE